MNPIKKLSLLFAICAFCNVGYAQKSTVFSGAFRVGLLNGQADKAGTELQLVGGLLHKTWFCGIGAGIDYYSGFKSIPVFFEIKKDFLKKNNTPFVCADIGYNWPLISKDYKSNSGLKYKFQGGAYYEVSAGYKFVLSESLSMALSAGYSYKNFKEKDSAYYGVGPFDQPLPPSVNLYDYKFSRLSVKMAFWF